MSVCSIIILIIILAVAAFSISIMVLACYYDYKDINKCVNNELKDWDADRAKQFIDYYDENFFNIETNNNRIKYLACKEILKKLKKK